jgi:enoyl-CoA hydratase
VLSGAGGNFSYGLDLVQMRDELRFALGGNNLAAERTAFFERLTTLQQATTAVLQCRKPVIAVISGWCVGAGIDIICAADIRIGSTDAMFSVRAVRMGIVEDVGSLQLLPRLIGDGAARELAFTGMDIDAVRAKELRLVNHVHDTPDRALAHAYALAKQIASNPPLAVQGVKQMMNEYAHRGLAESLRYNALWNAAFMQSYDFTEAMTAFAERREPQFHGR